MRNANFEANDATSITEEPAERADRSKTFFSAACELRLEPQESKGSMGPAEFHIIRQYIIDSLSTGHRSTNMMNEMRPNVRLWIGPIRQLASQAV